MQTVAGVRVRWFTSDEFIRPAEAGGVPINWCNQLDTRLVLLLDVLRNQWGRPIIISPAPGTIGRHHGSGYHVADVHGMVQAVDVMPGFKGPDDARHFVHLAEAIGFGGIGIYPVWRPMAGAHLDTGPFNRRWGRIGRADVSIGEALSSIRAS